MKGQAMASGVATEPLSKHCWVKTVSTVWKVIQTMAIKRRTGVTY